jgi:hypothetical protein
MQYEIHQHTYCIKRNQQYYVPLVKVSIADNSLLPVPEIIDPVFEKTSPKRSFSMTENERFGLVFVNTGSINSGTGLDLTLGQTVPIPF